MPLEQQIACVRREIALRRNAYPKFIANGRLTTDAASHEMLAMQAVLTTLTEILPRLLARVADLERAMDLYQDEARRSLQKLVEAGDMIGRTTDG